MVACHRLAHQQEGTLRGSTSTVFRGLLCTSGANPTLTSQDTAELFAAIEFDPAENKGMDVPRTTDRSLGEVGMIMFGGDEAKAPTRLGNAGNDAFVSVSCPGN